MKIFSLIILVVLTALPSYAQADECQLCMQTYKINCSICYNKCNPTKDFTNCTYSTCNTKDADGNCINWSPSLVNSTYCLGTCCGSFAFDTPFNEPNFNLCVERDAAQSYNVNIGLSIGLILSLMALLFFAGLGCLLVMMFYDHK